MIDVKVLRLPQIQSKLDYDRLVQPAMLETRDAIVKRWMRPRRRLGARNNTVTPTLAVSGARLKTTLRNKSSRIESLPSFGSGAGRVRNPRFNPRVTGRKWQDKLIAAGRSMAPSVMRRASQRIAAGWAA